MLSAGWLHLYVFERDDWASEWWHAIGW